MEKTAGVEFDCEIDEVTGIYRIDSPSTHRVMGVTFNIHYAMEVLIVNVQLYVDTISQAVD